MHYYLFTFSLPSTGLWMPWERCSCIFILYQHCLRKGTEEWGEFPLLMSSFFKLGDNCFPVLCWFLLYKCEAAMPCWPQSLSCRWLIYTLWTIPHQAPLSMGILQARILEWAAIPSSRDLPSPEIESRSSALQVDSWLSGSPGKPKNPGVGSLSLLQGIFLS